MSLHVAVLCGGTSLERDVSLRSGTRVTDALADRGHDVVRLDLDATLVPQLRELEPDVVFLALHGAAGEDGTVQSMLEVLDLPYTGSDALASSLAWNKPIAQGLYARAGCSVPASVRLSQQAFRELGAAAMLESITAELGLPLVVKPATGGSSLGITVVRDEAALAPAVVGAFSYGDAVLLERHVAGVEVAVGVLDGEPLPPVEIEPRGGVYDFAARYTAGATTFHVPARLDDEALARCTTTAAAAYAAIGARHVSRADMIVDGDGIPWLLEIDTCPGLTETSLLPVAAAAADLNVGALSERIAMMALR